MRRTYWKAINKGLGKEQFCEVLDALPIHSKFTLKNVSEEIDGEWVKEYAEETNTDSEKRNSVWHNITNDSLRPNASFLLFKDKVIDSIHLKETNYNKILARIFTKEKLESLYFGQKKCLEDIANEYSCSKMMVRNHMRKYGLDRRGQSEARVEAIKKGKFERFIYADIDENFFSQWSPQMSWVLGLLFTDGNVGPGRITLSSVDIDLLEKVRTLLGSKRPIAKREQSYDKTKHIYVLEFYREKMREDCKGLGLHEKKSLTLQFPDVPEEYKRHFIRGCWDGDGSVFISGDKLRASYVCGSLGFIERLAEELLGNGICRGLSSQIKYGKKSDLVTLLDKHPNGKFPVNVHKSKRSNSFETKIDSKENLERLFHYFYDGVDESMYLMRKHNVFVEGFKMLRKGESEQLTLDLPF